MKKTLTRSIEISRGVAILLSGQRVRYFVTNFVANIVCCGKGYLIFQQIKCEIGVVVNQLTLYCWMLQIVARTEFLITYSREPKEGKLLSTVLYDFSKGRI